MNSFLSAIKKIANQKIAYIWTIMTDVRLLLFWCAKNNETQREHKKNDKKRNTKIS